MNSLEDRLIDLTYKISNIYCCSPMDILFKSTIQNIAEAQPTTKEELLKVKGIGPKKLEKYGDRIIETINIYIKEKEEWEKEILKKLKKRRKQLKKYSDVCGFDTS